MNLVVLKGNLTKDPDVREINNNGRTVKVANFTIAVNRFFRKADNEKGKSTDFILCECWEKVADLTEQLLSKGDAVLVNGSLKSESWEKDGTRHFRTVVKVSNFDKLSFRNKDDSVEDDVEVEEADLVSTEEQISF